jgi:hypothetical protein
MFIVDLVLSGWMWKSVLVFVEVIGIPLQFCVVLFDFGLLYEIAFDFLGY